MKNACRGVSVGTTLAVCLIRWGVLIISIIGPEKSFRGHDLNPFERLELIEPFASSLTAHGGW